MIYLLLFLAVSPSANAVSLEVVGACSEQPLHSFELHVEQPISVGALSVDTLTKNRVPFDGTPEGISSILDTPTDKAAIEWLGTDELRAYGWCYSVDGVVPEVMPNEYSLLGEERVKWFFAFSHFKQGKFISQCEPAYSVQWKKLCGNSLRF